VAALVVGLFVLGAQPYAAGLIPSPLDKLAHVGLYGAIAALTWTVLGGRGRLAGLAAVLVSVAIGGADEIVQASLMGRNASLLDFSADILGAVLGLALMTAAVPVRRAPIGVESKGWP